METFKKSMVSAHELNGIKGFITPHRGCSWWGPLWRQCGLTNHFCSIHLSYFTLKGGVSLLPLDLLGWRPSWSPAPRLVLDPHILLDLQGNSKRCTGLLVEPSAWRSIPSSPPRKSQTSSLNKDKEKINMSNTNNSKRQHLYNFLIYFSQDSSSPWSRIITVRDSMNLNTSKVYTI